MRSFADRVVRLLASVIICPLRQTLRRSDPEFADGVAENVTTGLGWAERFEGDVAGRLSCKIRSSRD
jgi:hypothetical protein